MCVAVQVWSRSGTSGRTSANEAAEAEDQARADLKDSVDARLVAWRAGKENNLRALIASLDTVLWPALGWQKVGIHELVSPGQVKVRYTKAIAKLHPDKVRVCGWVVYRAERMLMRAWAAKRAEYDGGAEDDRQRGVRDLERGVERIQTIDACAYLRDIVATSVTIGCVVWVETYTYSDRFSFSFELSSKSYIHARILNCQDAFTNLR